MESSKGYFADRVLVHCITLILLTSLLLITSGTGDGILPGNVVPENYNLEIITRLEEDNDTLLMFEGKLVITVKCVEPTDTIVLNALNLKIQTVTIDTNNVKEWSLNKEDETMIIRLNKPLMKHCVYNLVIQYTGIFKSFPFQGYYANYDNGWETRTSKWSAMTHFEPTDARRAFPSFDEPRFKATYEISIGRSEKYLSLSNMPLKRTEPMKEMTGWFWDRYPKTVRMSSYLVAFIVSDYKPTVAPKVPTNNVAVTIWCREELTNFTDLATDVGPKSLEFFEKYFNIKYPLPKLDLVGLKKLSPGAMENWGLITFQEQYLLFNPEPLVYTTRTYSARIICHEIAHMWFGNLITMKWWNDLWLKEGFATFMEGIALHHIYPEWNALEEKTMTNLKLVFTSDSLNTSHPVSVPVKSRYEIDAIYDTISYQKGSCLVNMMFNFLGEEKFKKGITNYLEKHKYGNVEQDDLFMSLTFENELYIKPIMDTWTLQAGYPVITVNRSYEKNSATVTQKRFYSNTESLGSNECWWVPLTFTNQREKDFENTRPKDWLSCPKCAKIIPNIAGKNEWVIFNIKGANLYRVNYDKTNWDMLISTLNSDSYKDIPILNRVQLIEDSAALAAANKISYAYFFRLLKYLYREMDYLPWEAVSSNVNSFNHKIRPTKFHDKFFKYMQFLLTPIVEKMNNLNIQPGEPDEMKKIKLKATVLRFACNFLVGNCPQNSRRSFTDYITNFQNSGISGELRSVVYCGGIKDGSKEDWNLLWNRYKELEISSEKIDILEGLGCTKDPSLLQRYLEFTIDENSGLEPEHIPIVFRSIATNDEAYNIAKDFFLRNAMTIFICLEWYEEELIIIITIISECFIDTDADYNQFKKILSENSKILSKINNSVDRALEIARVNLQWREIHSDTIGQYFENS